MRVLVPDLLQAVPDDLDQVADAGDGEGGEHADRHHVQPTRDGPESPGRLPAREARRLTVGPEPWSVRATAGGRPRPSRSMTDLRASR